LRTDWKLAMKPQMTRSVTCYSEILVAFMLVASCCFLSARSEQAWIVFHAAEEQKSASLLYALGKTFAPGLEPNVFGDCGATCLVVHYHRETCCFKECGCLVGEQILKCCNLSTRWIPPGVTQIPDIMHANAINTATCASMA